MIVGTYAFDLVVGGFDVTDPGQLDRLWTNRFVIVPASADQVTTISIEIRADSNQDAVTMVLSHLATAVPEVTVERIDLDLVTTTEIAIRLGVDREAVRKWAAGERRSTESFPPHFARLPGGQKAQKVWRWASIYAWAIYCCPSQLSADLPEPLSPTVVDRFNGSLPLGGLQPCVGDFPPTSWSWLATDSILVNPR